MSQAQRRIVSRVVAPVAVLVGALILLVIGMVILLARQQTADALERQRELARGMIDIRLAELSNMTDDYAHWDEALQKLGLQIDRDWAAENIGIAMNKRFGVDMVFVLDSAGRTSYAMIGQADSNRPADQAITAGYRELLERRHSAGPDALASGLVVADGLPAFIVVAPLRPFLTSIDTTRQSRSLLVFVDLLDKPQLRHLADIYRLPNLAVAAAHGAEPTASIGLRTGDGRTDLSLAWEGDDPGARLLLRILPMLGGLLLAFAAMTVFVLVNAYRSAEKLRIAEDMAARDPLSGLWNRTTLANDLDRPFAKDEITPFTLFYLDLDGFKHINDTHGHDIGDVVIRTTSSRISESIPQNAKAYRLGGDEFAVIMPGRASKARLGWVAEAMLTRITAPIVQDGLTLHVGVTIGIARAPEDAQSATKVVRLADQALYAGKRSGKGIAQFAEPLHQTEDESAGRPDIEAEAARRAG
ncbi:hypothetical protein ASG54_02270 [Aureimonas sp. Leaf460]|nr:hypothetical protein ASG62_05005 [Aureimonas sp. Leaf427]KQT81532.1 hypothetical protein ASG54_02270 [Aureimonas sp. Leaf460]